jgi:hypothetical protein
MPTNPAPVPTFTIDATDPLFGTVVTWYRAQLRNQDPPPAEDVFDELTTLIEEGRAYVA